MQSPQVFDADKRKLLSALSHGSIFLSVTMFAIGIPLIILFITDDPIVKKNAKESINFHFNVWFWGSILLGLYGVLSWLTFGLLGIVLFPLVALGFLWHWGLTVMAIFHCLTDSDDPYKYPFIFRLLW